LFFCRAVDADAPDRREPRGAPAPEASAPPSCIPTCVAPAALFSATASTTASTTFVDARGLVAPAAEAPAVDVPAVDVPAVDVPAVDVPAAASGSTSTADCVGTDTSTASRAPCDGLDAPPTGSSARAVAGPGALVGG
jgi:hypothetical protein